MTTRRVSLMALVLLASAACGGGGSSSGATSPGGGGGGGGNTAPVATNAVTASSSNQFVPANITVAIGTTVTWTFESTTHNVTFGGGTGVPANIINTANASASRTFSTAGTFAYTCTLHSSMQGSVLVH